MRVTAPEVEDGMRSLRYGQLGVRVYSSYADVGSAAAWYFADAVRDQLLLQDVIAVILSTGNSQLSFFQALLGRHDIDWGRLIVLQADEYVGLAPSNPVSLQSTMQQAFVRHAGVKAFVGFEGDRVPVEDEVKRYAAIVGQLSPVLCVIGIGENGHIGFNDPPADFVTENLVRVVTLDARCRAQQVGEGHFASVEQVPPQGLTLTVHALLQPPIVMVVTPERRKAEAVWRTLEGPVSPDCPASILRRKAGARLYLDEDSAALLNRGESVARGEGSADAL